MYARPIIAEVSMSAEENGCCWVFVNGTAIQVPAACEGGNFPTCSPAIPANVACVIATPRNPVANVIVCGYANPKLCTG